MAAEVMRNATGKGEEWVGPYVNMVYRAAVRQMGDDEHGAGDVTQAVFLVVLRKAKSGKLPEEGRMAGWLLKVTGNAVREWRRAALRRKFHEGRATGKREEAAAVKVNANEVRGALDEALLKLGAVDREVIVRHYLRGEAVPEVAAAVGRTEPATRQRIRRALEKLRAILQRRGVIVPATVLVALMVEESAKAAPAAVVAGVTSGASAAAVGIAKGAAAMMTWAAMKTAAVVMLGAMVLMGTGLVAAGQMGRAGPGVATSRPVEAAAEPKAATRPVQTTWYLMGEEIYANKAAAEKAREAGKMEEAMSADLSLRDKVAELYSQAIDLQPGAAINAMLAERIAQLYSLGHAAKGIDQDQKKVAIWLKRAAEWAEPGTALWEPNLAAGVARSGPYDLRATAEACKAFLDYDLKQVRWPSWRLLYGSWPEGKKPKDGPLSVLPDPKASPLYEEEMQRLREQAIERKRRSAEAVVEGCFHSLEWPIGGPETPSALQLAERKAEAVKVLRELSARYQGTPFGECFDEGITEVLASAAAVKLGANPALPPKGSPPAPPDPPADTYLGRMQAAANKAVAADPADLKTLKQSLASAIEVQAWLSPQPGEAEVVHLRHAREVPFGLPDRVAEELVAAVRSSKSGKVSLVLAVPPELRVKRDRLLAEADAKIRAGLEKALTDRLGEPENLPAWDKASPAGRIAVAWGYTSGRRSAYSVLVFVVPPPAKSWQCLSWGIQLPPLYPNLGLVGHVGTYAQDPELNASLKQILADALVPLKELEAEAAKAPRPEPSPAADPDEVARAAERAAMMRKELSASPLATQPKTGGTTRPRPTALEKWFEGKEVVVVTFGKKGPIEDPPKVDSPVGASEFSIQPGSGGGLGAYVNVRMRVTPENVERVLALEDDLLARGYPLALDHCAAVSFECDPAVRKAARELLPAAMAALSAGLEKLSPGVKCTIPDPAPRGLVAAIRASTTAGRGGSFSADVYETAVKLSPGTNAIPDQSFFLPHLALVIDTYSYVRRDPTERDAIRKLVRQSLEPILKLEPGGGEERDGGLPRRSPTTGPDTRPVSPSAGPDAKGAAGRATEEMEGRGIR